MLLIKKIVLLAFCLLLCGCLKTPITAIDIDETVRALALSSHETIHVQIHNEVPSPVIGHQYLFVALPFGRVVVENMDQYIFQNLFTTLALKGRKPILAQSTNLHYPSLTLRVKHAQATAYDFFALRWIKVRLVIEVDYALTAEQKYTKEFFADSSAFKRFAFSKQLSFYFNKSAQKLFQEIADFTDPQGSVFESRY